MGKNYNELSKEKIKRLGKLYSIDLEEYDDNWNDYYDKEKKYLMKVFEDNVYRISYIGSTSIRGLISKPTIDI